jgi:hypothetical protein
MMGHALPCYFPQDGMTCLGGGNDGEGEVVVTSVLQGIIMALLKVVLMLGNKVQKRNSGQAI